MQATLIEELPLTAQVWVSLNNQSSIIESCVMSLNKRSFRGVMYGGADILTYYLGETLVLSTRLRYLQNGTVR